MTIEAFQTVLANFAEGYILPKMNSGLAKWILGGAIATTLPRVAEMLAPAGVLSEDGEVDGAKLRAFLTGAFKAEPALFIKPLNITLQEADSQVFLANYMPPAG
jgi:hypothetical protein